MVAIYIFQYLFFCLCIQLFSIFRYISFNSDLVLTSTYSVENRSQYDYIIVGAGTAGSLIAHRIATETNYTYIILEAGGKSNDILDIPVLGPLLFGSMYDWQFETVPQEASCFAMKDKKCRLPQGKIVGGSSKLNNMIHIRGNISHYVNWFHGKYSKTNIEDHFQQIEKELIHLDEIKYHSTLSDGILEAAVELDYNILDLNSKFSKGFMKSKVSQKYGKRWTTSDNIKWSKHLITKAFVTKIDIDCNNVARGVYFLQQDKNYFISAKKSVIVSAGTLNTPKILQLSGIGPSNLLNSLNIPITKDLPVGLNLQDHVTTGMDLIMFNKSLNIGATDMLNPYHIYQYFHKGKGPLTSPGCEVVGFLSTTNSETPDLQFMVLPVGITSDQGSHIKSALGVDNEVWNNYFAKTLHKYTASILPILLHPKSKGKVFITSKDPLKPPLVDTKYLSVQTDIDILVKGLKLILEFVNTEALQNLGAYINPHSFPGCEKYALFSDKYWKCYVKHWTLSSYHPVGTCRLGLPESNYSVVDTSFQVIGIKNLFISDGSVLPTLPSGNINAAIAMMANLFFEDTISQKKVVILGICKVKNYLEVMNRICCK